MLVAVVSDSHNNSEAVDLAKKAISKCDVLLFLGDGEGDLENLTFVIVVPLLWSSL